MGTPISAVAPPSVGPDALLGADLLDHVADVGVVRELCDLLHVQNRRRLGLFVVSQDLSQPAEHSCVHRLIVPSVHEAAHLRDR